MASEQACSSSVELAACRHATSPAAARPPAAPLSHAAGLNLVLISRTESKLKECAAELENKHGVEARYVVADLCKATPETFASIGAALQGLEASCCRCWF